jgi:hypothetical protein
LLISRIKEAPEVYGCSLERNGFANLGMGYTVSGTIVYQNLSLRTIAILGTYGSQEPDHYGYS